jgi:hypothetical protein
LRVEPTLTIDATDDTRAAYPARAIARQGRRMTLDLDRVAQVYRDGGRKPLRAVMAHSHVSEATPRPR